MAKPPSLLVADAEFLAELPDVQLGSPLAQAIEQLAESSILVTVPEARRRAEASFQAVVNSHLFQKIAVVKGTIARRARAKSLGYSMPTVIPTRHMGMSELAVVAAAFEGPDGNGGVVTTSHRRRFYERFDPPLEISVFVRDELPSFVK